MTTRSASATANAAALAEAASVIDTNNETSDTQARYAEVVLRMGLDPIKLAAERSPAE